MATGTVKWFSVDRRFGFIVPDEGGKDVFVHQNSIAVAEIRSLSEGQRVSYELESSDKGPQAADVRPA
jgi:CspA family cold shock protein